MPLKALRRVPAGSFLILAITSFLASAAALVLGWTAFGRQLDEYAYDFLFRLEQPAPWKPQSAILAIDEATLAQYGGLIGIRSALAEGIEKILPVHPKAIAVDIILAEPGSPETDRKLEAAFARAPNWCFRAISSAPARRSTGKIQSRALPGTPQPSARCMPIWINTMPSAGICPLEKIAGRQRRWALALAAWAAATHAEIVESPDEIAVGRTRIPAPIRDGRVMRIRYAPVSMGGIPSVSIADLNHAPASPPSFPVESHSWALPRKPPSATAG